jgi:hypothetical protein
MNNTLFFFLLILLILLFIIFIIFYINKYCKNVNNIVIEDNYYDFDINYENLEDPISNESIEREYEVAEYYYNNKEDDSECSICLEQLHDSEVQQLTCLHKYHKKCLEEWSYKKENNIICPECGK